MMRFLGGLTLLLSLTFALLAQANESIELSEAPTILETGTKVRVHIEINEKEQVLVGIVSKLDAQDFPGILAVASNEHVFHMIQVDKYKGSVDVFPNDFNLNDLHSVIDLRVVYPKFSFPVGKPDQVKEQKKVSDYLLRNNSQVMKLAVKIQAAQTAVAWGSLFYYNVFWDGAFRPAASLWRPFFASHFSSYVLSAIGLTTAAGFQYILETESPKTRRIILVAAAAAMVTIHAILEIKGFAPHSWTQFMGPNVPDMGDFYVGAGAAVATTVAPFWIEKVAMIWRRTKAVRSMDSCSQIMLRSSTFVYGD